MFNRSFSTIALSVLAGVLAVSCGEKTPQEVVEPSVSLVLTEGSVTDSIAAFTIVSSDCERVAWLLSGSPVDQIDAALVFADGTTAESVPDDGKVPVELEGLTENTAYYVYAAGISGEYSAVAGPLQFTTAEAPVELPEEIDVAFTGASNVSEEDGKFVLEFVSDGLYTMSAEIVSEEFAGIHRLGESLVKEATSLVISGHEIPELDGTYSFVSGELAVAGDGETWTISGQLVAESGLKVNVSYEGAVEGIVVEKYDYEIEFTAADQYKGIEGPQSIFVRFSSPAEGDYLLSLWLFVDESELSPITGTYTFAQWGEQQPGQFTSNSCMWIGSSEYSLTGGTVEVVKDRAHYQFDMVLTLSDGKKAHVIFDGILGGAPEMDIDNFDYDVEFDTASNTPQSNPDNFYIYFDTLDQKYSIYLDIYGTDGVLATGDYFSGSAASGMFTSSYTKVIIEGNTQKITKGEVRVENNNDGSYDFEMIFQLDDGKYFRGTYNGTI